VTPVVRALLIANVAVFFVQYTMPALANAFVFVPRYILLRPWSVVTYMFLHGGLMHLAFNMFALYIFGPRVEERIGSRRFSTLYFVSGISGALLSFVFSPGAALVGASGGVFGVTLAFAYFWPDALVAFWFLPMPARVMVIFTTVVSLWSGITGAGGNIAHFAHLGGYAGADLYLKWLDRARAAFKRQATGAPPTASQRLSGWRSIDKTKIHEVNRDEVDRILDKINAQGLGSLTEQERLFLSNFVPPDDRVPPAH
jgi:membrane associated rhomboid family serine protease